MRQIKNYLKEILFFLMVAFIIGNGVSLYRASKIDISDEVCQDGADMIYFFATWCPVCKIVTPNINRVAKDFYVVGVAVKSKDTDRYLDENNYYNFGYIDDKNGSLAKQAHIEVFPTTITCKDKKVFFVDMGYTSTLGLYLKLLLAKVFS